ncbi:Mu transposase C-terminal domain-containing protein [Roseburia hominis]
MKKNSLLKQVIPETGDAIQPEILRVLELTDEEVLVIGCRKRTMPGWWKRITLQDYESMTEEELWELTGIRPRGLDSLTAEENRFVHEHFTLIAGILPFIADEKERSRMVASVAKMYHVSKQTVRYYLCLYLVYQDMSVLAPKRKAVAELSDDEKNMRWALNKFYYTKNKNSLTTAYTLMLKERYCNSRGELSPERPTIHQFRYFYRKTKNLQDYYITRDGMKDYQRNHRPLLGDGVQEFASGVGVAMLDSTICDIYLVNESGGLVGRPILTACVDAYSGMCCGYSLGWEGGTYSLRGLMLNVIADKKEHCRQHGIGIDDTAWDCSRLPATLVTDKGAEYASENFGQLAELGVTIINLPSFRPELKGPVEKFFDLIQSTYKAHLKGRGVIEVDYRERGAHDYRKDACLTLEQFEKILIHCIIYYNSRRIVENFPYTEDMLEKGVRPYASDIWNYGMGQPGAHLLDVHRQDLIHCLFPRTAAKFTRRGLKANGLRYRHDNYTELYLKGGDVVVAYNPEDVSCVWLIENGAYVRFELIETRFTGKDLCAVQECLDRQKKRVQRETGENLQARVELANHIEAIIGPSRPDGRTSLHNIRKNRQREQERVHRDYGKEDGDDV